jgi:ASC-1-like (ASCH) protein
MSTTHTLEFPETQEFSHPLFEAPKKTDDFIEFNEFDRSGIQILCTTNYERLILREDNRKIDFKTVQRLIQSFYKDGILFVPGVVNKYREVIDGQHRLAALKQIAETTGHRIPFYFIPMGEYSEKEMIIINKISNIWGKPQYLDHYVVRENKNYILFKQFKEDFPWTNASTSEALFTGKIDGVNTAGQTIPNLASVLDLTEYKEYTKTKKSGRHVNIIGRKESFEEGLLKPDDLNEAYNRAYELEKLGKYYTNFANTNFVKAYLNVRKVKGFSFEEMLKQFEKVYTNMRNEKFKIDDSVSHKISSYRDCFNDIYNFKRHEASCINLRSIKR